MAHAALHVSVQKVGVVVSLCAGTVAPRYIHLYFSVLTIEKLLADVMCCFTFEVLDQKASLFRKLSRT